MDEKQPLPYTNAPPSEAPRPRRALLPVFLRAAVIALLTLFVLFFPTGIESSSLAAGDQTTDRSGDGVPHAPVAEAKRVPLEAHIMSKCPDALDCLQLLVLPTMVEISDRIDFKLSYIGKPTDHDDGVECKHGESECLGNMIELCAADKYPDPKIYLGFTYCLTRQYEKIAERHMIQDCAMEHGIDFARINDCLTQDDGGYVADLLQASFVRSAEANVTKSCTIRLDEKVRCIRDGGEWKDCPGGSDRDSLIRDINNLYQELNAA
ncbi:Gamma interferon inducible lysosomal thiol reductase GILT [Macrophomina phaseolina MS6]|uniref:Gamma interferon inducible lysosomal thiol reductase GILT n=1 Tax=Macrophomina phaseolina (strain MS6) TaxID=1126212 RepID=K2RPC9_MACPH|nr:Gamma interferon inducible lysosomal thiol reductase GILT [Macrophomina phaseolina MS6]